MRSFLRPLLFVFALVALGLGAHALAGPPLRMDSIGIIQARGFSEVDAGVTVHNGDLTIVGQGPLTVLPQCKLSAGTTCSVADTGATALSQLYCGPLFGFTDGGAVTAASVTSVVLNQGVGWTVTVSASTTGVVDCFRIN